jgi:excisionase family DNA binding protein
MRLNVDITQTDFKALAENNMTLTPEEFRHLFTPPLGKNYIYKCLEEQTLIHYKTGNRHRIPYSELRDFRNRLLLGPKKAKKKPRQDEIGTEQLGLVT